MTDPSYFSEFPHYALQRTESGVITVRLHTDGGPALLGTRLHQDFPLVMNAVAHDRDNKVMVLTGTGDHFMTGMEPPSGRETFKPLVFDAVFWEGRTGLQSLVDLPMPIVSAINGPATFHSEWVLLGDITVAADTSVFQDAAHFGNGVAPGDGIHVVWEELIGLNRARYAALTQQIIDAEEALRIGMVNEVVPFDDVLPRALQLAEDLAARPQLVLRLTPLILRQRLSQRLSAGTTLGLALEALTIADWPYRETT